MSNNNFHIHNVTRVAVESEEIGFDSGNGYTVYRLEIHSDNPRDEDEVLRVTLYGTVGDHYGPGVPFEFSKVEEDAQ